MLSKWSHLKEEAVSIRKKGNSLIYVESTLGIPRSTLSGWFKNIELTKLQKEKLRKKHNEALARARIGAVSWHHTQKLERLRLAEIEADKTISLIKNNNEIIELALALLYLGEGFKKADGTGIGNSDPLILKFFLKILSSVYKIDMNKIRVYLHLRADQNVELARQYWSKELNVPIDRFGKVSIDMRTKGRKTYSDYKGVCVIHCGNVAIQRKLVYIAKKFCEEVVRN